jgi:hypothetical protein
MEPQHVKREAQESTTAVRNSKHGAPTVAKAFWFVAVLPLKDSRLVGFFY